jgi:hypothetical protein
MGDCSMLPPPDVTPPTVELDASLLEPPDAQWASSLHYPLSVQASAGDAESAVVFVAVTATLRWTCQSAPPQSFAQPLGTWVESAGSAATRSGTAWAHCGHDSEEFPPFLDRSLTRVDLRVVARSAGGETVLERTVWRAVPGEPG